MIRLVAFFVLYPLTGAMILVEIHRDAFYRPSSLQIFIRNDSLLSNSSMQSCAWRCVQDRDCRTAVYFNVAQNCSLFSEFCHLGTFPPSGIERASVICYRKDQGRRFLFSREPCCRSSLLVPMTTYASTPAQTPTSEPIRPITCNVSMHFVTDSDSFFF